MDYIEEYPHLEFRFVSGSKKRLRVDRLLSNYHVFNAMGTKQAHVVHESNIRETDRPYKKGVGICGRETKNKAESDTIIAEFMCKDCMKKMNKMMKHSFWDDVNEEYYHPRFE